MRRLLALVAVAISCNIGNAYASTIDFEDLALDLPGVGGDRTSRGFFFDTAANHSHIDDGTSWGTTDGTQILVVDDLFGVDPVTFSPTAGGAFNLTSIDLSEAHTFASAHRIQVTGTRFGGGVDPTPLTLTLDFFANPPGLFGFQTFGFGSDWTNLASVTLRGTDGIANYFAIDNVVVTPVPEPGTLALLGLGSAYLIRRRRNRR